MKLCVTNHGGSEVTFRFVTSGGTSASGTFDTPDWEKRARQMSAQHKVPLVIRNAPPRSRKFGTVTA